MADISGHQASAEAAVAAAKSMVEAMAFRQIVTPPGSSSGEQPADTTSTAAPQQARANSSSTPAGKVKVSFNLLPSEVDALRELAGRLGTTVTNVLQRAIRDEVFLQQCITEGKRIALVDQDGVSREIIWR